MPFAQAGDIRMFYQIAGTGPRLLYISGTGGDLRRRPSVFDSPLPEHFEVLGYDQRGLGQTDRPETDYSMADYADDAARLLDALGWDRCLVMGVSFGGMVAQEFAVRHPQRVERLVLACTSSGGAGGSSWPLHELHDLPDKERARRAIEISDTRRDEAWQREQPDTFAAVLAQTMAGYQVGRDEPGRREGARRQLEARRHHDVYDRLPSLTMPVLVCGGMFDGLAPPDNLLAIARQIHGAWLELFEGGHLFLQQDRRAYARVIDFLST